MIYGFLFFLLIYISPYSVFALSNEEYDKFLKNIDQHFDNSEFSSSNDFQDDFFVGTNTPKTSTDKPVGPYEEKINTNPVNKEIAPIQDVRDLKIPDLKNDENLTVVHREQIKNLENNVSETVQLSNAKESIQKNNNVVDIQKANPQLDNIKGSDINLPKNAKNPNQDIASLNGKKLVPQSSSKQKVQSTNEKSGVDKPLETVAKDRKIAPARKKADVSKASDASVKKNQPIKNEDKPDIKTELVDDAPSSSESRVMEVAINQRKIFSNMENPLNKRFEIKRELNEHIQVNTYQHEYSQLLFVAASRGDIGAIKALLDKKADINAQDNINGHTPLMYAIAAGKISAMQYLISKGADINKITYTAKNALHIAAITENREAFKILLKAGCNLSAVDTRAMRPFDYVSRDRENFAMYSMPEEFSINQILIGCTIMNMQGCLKDALARGADVNCSDDDGNTPLMIAVRHGLIDLIKLIFEYNPDLKRKNNRGYSVFDIAGAINDKLTMRLISELSRPQNESSTNTKKIIIDTPMVLDKTYMKQ
ncbi:Ankyrin repeat domain-containing protein [Candidatus Cyrtobacter comes]|uniref:Ankyrin repeat domain-containing protein n=1 Tax=Candidatus Cyrtobacter comes TaxID=675776 RepID=A0ABU5L8H7_9RICK|nr:ankyrin repeat domain-containing protein [Candidatus Cyrtobacter comes]MDZ5762421.1 Ankyrin repeat domain-containing protein [Candidatus Cyrtobacter comes]